MKLDLESPYIDSWWQKETRCKWLRAEEIVKKGKVRKPARTCEGLKGQGGEALPTPVE